MDANADLSVAVNQWFSDAIEARGTDWAVVGDLLVKLAGAHPFLAVNSYVHIWVRALSCAQLRQGSLYIKSLLF